MERNRADFEEGVAQNMKISFVYALWSWASVLSDARFRCICVFKQVGCCIGAWVLFRAWYNFCCLFFGAGIVFPSFLLFFLIYLIVVCL